MNVKPTRKVTAGTAAGLLSTVIVSIATANGVDIPPDAAAGLTALLGLAAAWATRDKSDQDKE